MRVTLVAMLLLSLIGCGGNVGRSPADLERQVFNLAIVVRGHAPVEGKNEHGETYFIYQMHYEAAVIIYAPSRDALATEIRVVVPSAGADAIGQQEALRTLAQIVNAFNDKSSPEGQIAEWSPGEKAMEWAASGDFDEGDLKLFGKCPIQVLGKSDQSGLLLDVG